jgi:hypothetical protein
MRIPNITGTSSMFCRFRNATFCVSCILVLCLEEEGTDVPDAGILDVSSNDLDRTVGKTFIVVKQYP